MSRPKGRKPIPRTTPADNNRRRSPRTRADLLPLQPEDPRRNLYFHIFAIVLLLVLGIYISVIYFGHQVVPNSDFPAFLRTGRTILSFEMPSSFKRVPLLGMLQIMLSYLVGGQHPELTAGWLLNAILFPLTGIFLYLMGKELIGKNAVWLALLFLINPLSIKLLRHPIVETTLVFFVVLTFYFIVRRSRWCYLFAALTTMVRYEGAALIMVAFVLDMIESKTWRQRMIALLLSALATIPLGLWMYGTYTHDKAFQATGAKKASGHYVSHYDIKNRNVIKKFANYSWQVSLGPLLGTAHRGPYPTEPDPTLMIYRPLPESGENMPVIFHQLRGISKVVLVVGLFLAVGFCVFRRQWKVLPLLLFLIAYFLAHSLRYGTQARYAWPIAWLILLLCFYGWQSGWLQLKKLASIPPILIIVLQVVLLIGALVWLGTLIRFLPSISYVSEKSAYLPYVVLAGIGAVPLVGAFIFQSRFIWRDLCLASVIGMMVIASQFTLVRTVGNGSGDLEFKLLADWYVDNAQPGEKIVTTMPHIATLYAPQYKDNFVKTSHISGKSPQQFVQNCYKRGVTYVAWDSRIGLSSQNSYYKQWRMKNLHFLYRPQPQDIGPFKFIHQIKLGSRRFIYIFRLQPLGSESQK